MRGESVIETEMRRCVRGVKVDRLDKMKILKEMTYLFFIALEML